MIDVNNLIIELCFLLSLVMVDSSCTVLVLREWRF